MKNLHKLRTRCCLKTKKEAGPVVTECMLRTSGYKFWLCHLLALWFGQVVHFFWFSVLTWNIDIIAKPVFRFCVCVWALNKLQSTFMRNCFLKHAVSHFRCPHCPTTSFKTIYHSSFKKETFIKKNLILNNATLPR